MTKQRPQVLKKRKHPKSYRCPTELTLDVLGGKWKTVILCFLNQRSCRYAELRKLTPNLSDKILTERLTDLVDSGLVLKKRAPGQARIAVYVLTKMPKARKSGHFLILQRLTSAATPSW